MAVAGGVETVTMRALADALGVSAMALYAHVSDKDDILDAVIESRLRAIGLPDRDMPWSEWIVEISQGLLGILAKEPALLDRYGRRPVGVPAALARMDAALGVLVNAGFDGESAVAAFAATHTYTIGFAVLEAARNEVRLVRVRKDATTLDNTDLGYWPALFATLDDEYPQLALLRPDLVAFTTDQQFVDGLTALIDGLDRRHRSIRAPRTRRTSGHTGRIPPGTAQQLASGDDGS